MRGGGVSGIPFFSSRNISKCYETCNNEREVISDHFLIPWLQKVLWIQSVLELRKRKLRETAEDCRREGLVFLPFAVETLGGLSPGCSHPSQVAGKCTDGMQGARGGWGERPALWQAVLDANESECADDFVEVPRRRFCSSPNKWHRVKRRPSFFDVLWWMT